MSKHQENRILRQLNRGLIASLSLVGVLLDGAQLSDLVLQGAAMIWLWSQELQSVEAACWHRLRSRRGRCPNPRLVPVIPWPGGPSTR
jgi:hypothetical protein